MNERPPPTRFVNLHAARARFGDRVDRLGAMFHRGDPLADDAAEALAALPADVREATLERALRQGCTGDEPEALQALVAQCARVPFWGRLRAATGAGGGAAVGASRG
ncbi:MAG: hypothetical protein U0325_33815 [Polyangiales bacterium]